MSKEPLHKCMTGHPLLIFRGDECWVCKLKREQAEKLDQMVSATRIAAKKEVVEAVKK